MEVLGLCWESSTWRGRALTNPVTTFTSLHHELRPFDFPAFHLLRGAHLVLPVVLFPYDPPFPIISKWNTVPTCIITVASVPHYVCVNIVT